MSKLTRMILKSLKSEKDIWDLYKNKPVSYRLKMIFYTSDILDPIFNIYYSIIRFFNNVRRFVEYAPIVWRHRTYDYGYVLKFNKKLHEDLYEACYVNGHHVFSKYDARKLKTVIGLYDRLQKDEYDEKLYEEIDKKYGETKIYFRKIEGTEDRPGGPYHTMGNEREDKLSEQQKKKYLADLKKVWQHKDHQRQQDLELLGKYIAKYSKKWWD